MAEVLHRSAGDGGDLILVEKASVSPALVFLAQRSLSAQIAHKSAQPAKSVLVLFRRGSRLPALSQGDRARYQAIVDRLLAAPTRSIPGIGSVSAITEVLD